MNPAAQQPPPLRLQWIPVSPSWLVSAGIVLLAVLPHQMPQVWHRLMMNTVVRVMFAAASAFVWMKAPVLGTAMFILLFSMIVMPVSESFTIMNLNRDRVKQGRSNWLNEDIMSEDPHGIQDRTEETNLNYDKVDEHHSVWHSENVMGEQPTAIQDKPVPVQSTSEFLR